MPASLLKTAPIPLESIYGVDFSGAALAGQNIFIARLTHLTAPKPTLASLARLADLAGTPDRAPALAHLVTLIRTSTSAAWAIDFPFALPLELFTPSTPLATQLAFIATFPKAQPLGHWCVQTSLARTGKMHTRRHTDTLSKTPFDCYHYRIIHQTYHGMKDVLTPLTADPHTAILPFHPVTSRTKRLVFEACPSSTLKRLSLPHQNYKQPAGGPLTPKRRATRKVLYTALHTRLTIPAPLERLFARNPGGDALDAVIAALGALDALTTLLDPHPRYPLEGRVYY